MKNDLSALSNMEYSGRTIIAGLTPKGDIYIAYSLQGRSPPSKKRKFKIDENSNVIRTVPSSPEAIKNMDSALLLYPTIVGYEKKIFATNGAQTKLIYNQIQKQLMVQKGGDYKNIDCTELLVDGLYNNRFFEYDSSRQMWIDITSFEPDDIHTSRIASVIDGTEVSFFIARDIGVGNKPDELKNYWGFRPADSIMGLGVGLFLSTYDGGNENPQPLPFSGEPRRISINANSAGEIADLVFEAINGKTPEKDFRVAVAVMKYCFIDGKYEMATRSIYE